MIPKNSSSNHAIILVTAAVLILSSLACVATGSRGPTAAEGGDAPSCSALGEVKIELASFSEEPWTHSDGSPGGTECAYTYQVTNLSDRSVILLYFDHFSYGENPPPNDYEFSWQKTAPIPPGESWLLASSASSTVNQPLYLDLITNAAVIYDTPSCSWLIEGGVQPAVLEIEVDESLQAPCQLIDLESSPDAIPDLLKGLAVD